MEQANKSSQMIETRNESVTVEMLTTGLRGLEPELFRSYVRRNPATIKAHMIVHINHQCIFVAPIRVILT